MPKLQAIEEPQPNAMLAPPTVLLRREAVGKSKLSGGFKTFRDGSRIHWLSAWADAVDAAVVGRVAA